jgi:hypothetical protein
VSENGVASKGFRGVVKEGLRKGVAIGADEVARDDFLGLVKLFAGGREGSCCGFDGDSQLPVHNGSVVKSR